MLISELWVTLFTDYFFHSAIEQDYFFLAKDKIRARIFFSKKKTKKPSPPPQDYQMDRALVFSLHNVLHSVYKMKLKSKCMVG